jgi:hypothetical protein
VRRLFGVRDSGLAWPLTDMADRHGVSVKTVRNILSHRHIYEGKRLDGERMVQGTHPAILEVVP